MNLCLFRRTWLRPSSFFAASLRTRHQNVAPTGVSAPAWILFIGIVSCPTDCTMYLLSGMSPAGTAAYINKIWLEFRYSYVPGFGAPVCLRTLRIRGNKCARSLDSGVKTRHGIRPRPCNIVSFSNAQGRLSYSFGHAFSMPSCRFFTD